MNRRNSLEFKHIETKQLKDSYVVKLVVFNPSSQVQILQSLEVYKKTPLKNFFLQLIGKTHNWQPIRTIWWPTEDEDQLEIRYFSDEFRNLYVEGIKVLMVSIEGFIDRTQYKFHLKVSHDEQVLITTINGSNTQFSHSFHRTYYEK
ncbi:hypothetical protein QYS48_05220 [Marivirga arenosa]|uniref:Uncharacterized protein n=1 Tax=Marivirga arenosa TaxID=3059076 RepID=A0AA49GG56_9BACT|nr:hypothetical protein [Marivirga sp. ABR2-2]WKK86367.2 hypothetical protein QYS48_05220 [Marivirga sp. ABR2-2]